MLKGWNVVELTLQHFNLHNLITFQLIKNKGDYVLQKG